MPAQSKPVKRNRGGQKGNQNARKHGFYSSALTPDEISQFWCLISQDHIDPEMAIMRIKLQSLFKDAPADVRTIKKAARLIVKWFACKYKMDRSDRAYAKACILTALAHYSGISLGNDEKLFSIIINYENKTGGGIKGLLTMFGS